MHVKCRLCTKCKESLTEDNSNPSTLRRGCGCCRKCDATRNRECYKGLYTERHKKFRTSIKGRYRWLLQQLRAENVSEDDLLWSLNFYTALMSDMFCHYCGGVLSAGGHGLDRMENDEGHRCFNVVPCCPRCNSVKSNYFSYAEMLLLSPTLRLIREARR
jgi:hypothetical protein